MNSMNYIGLDIHKKSISCCVRQADGTIYPGEHDRCDPSRAGRVDAATATAMMAGMEATLSRRSRSGALRSGAHA
jgi:hypothetical protein